MRSSSAGGNPAKLETIYRLTVGVEATGPGNRPACPRFLGMLLLRLSLSVKQGRAQGTAVYCFLRGGFPVWRNKASHTTGVGTCHSLRFSYFKPLSPRLTGQTREAGSEPKVPGPPRNAFSVGECGVVVELLTLPCLTVVRICEYL